MNWDSLQGNWKVAKGKIQERWGLLTDDDLKIVSGRREQLIGRLQSRYGKTRDEIAQEVEDFCDECGCTMASTSSAYRPPHRIAK
jgi:uncharacterized protein YjbJ (UPF0337 family)